MFAAKRTSLSDDLEHMSLEGRYLAAINYFDSSSARKPQPKRPSSSSSSWSSAGSEKIRKREKSGRFSKEAIKWLMMAAILEAAASNYDGRGQQLTRSEAPPPASREGVELLAISKILQQSADFIEFN